MTSKSEWQEANRELIAEQRRRLGDPPTAEEMLAFSRGELAESEAERMRDLIAAYPELARMYHEPFPDEGDEVPDDRLRASRAALQRRLDGPSESAAARSDAQRGRVVFLRYVPTAIAAAVALVCFGLFVRAETRARYYASESSRPRVLGVAQELDPDGNRGPAAATVLRRDGEAYLLKPRLIHQMRYPHYQLELRDAKGAVIWTNKTAQPDLDDVFQILIPHTFLRAGDAYRLRIHGVDGESSRLIGVYVVSAPAE